MGHPEIEDRTGYALAWIYPSDEEGRPHLVALVQATFDLDPRRGLVLAAEQARVVVEGELYGADAATSSYRREPEIAFVKPLTDVVVLGHAIAPRGGATQAEVSVRVGPLSKTVRVVGDRTFVRSMGTISITRALPFDRMPLVYERAFGGWDRTAGDGVRAAVETTNPVGRGFRGKGSAFEEGLPLPNLEDPAQPLRAYGDVVPAVGFGVVSPGWQPRAAFAGTFDAEWARDRQPLPPKDFDRRFFNAASPGLAGALRGDEPVAISGASPHGALVFRLPGLPPPAGVAVLRRRRVPLAMKLDMVTVDLDADRVFVAWRGAAPLDDGPHDVRVVQMGAV